jgi:hypothetical protein
MAVAKKKKKNRQRVDAVPAQPVRAPFWNPRRSVIFSLAALALLWLIQFYSVLSGGGHFWEDVILQDFPVRVFSRTAFFSGEFPHWNPYTLNGMPFFAMQVPGVLYPFNVLLSLLPVNDDIFWWLLEACIALHVLIAGVTMFFYLRFKKRSDAASLFGAIAFMFGGFIITHIIHTMMVYIMAWLPLILLLLERGIREIKPVYGVAGGLLLGVTMLAGHPQLSFYELLFLFAICAFLFYRCKDRLVGRAAIAAAFFAVAAGICLVQYLPTIEMNRFTHRTEYTIENASESSMQFVQIITALIPKVFGAFTGGDKVPLFWLEDSFRHGYFNYWETCFYFGVSTLLLSFFWFRKVKTNRAALFALVWIAASFCIALGGNFFVYRLLFALKIPGFTMFRIPARIVFTWGFLFPVIAAAALDALNELKSKRLKIISLSICAAFAAFGLVTAAGGLASFFPLMNAGEGRAQYASGQGFILLLNAGLVGVVLILLFKDIVNVRMAKILITACLAIDMLSFAAGQHITRGGGGAPAEFRKAKGNAEAIKKQQANEPFRLNMRQFAVTPGSKIGPQTPSMLMNKNQGLVDNIRITEGYTPLLIKHYLPPLNAEKFNVVLDLLNVKYYFNPDYRQGEQNFLLNNKTYLPCAKLFYKAKVIGGDGSAGDYDSLVLDYMNSGAYDHQSEVVVTDPRLAGFTAGGDGGKAQITKYGINRIEVDVDTDREAILWLSEIWYPAWKAAVNGKKVDVLKADYSFRAVTVPAGKSKVVFRFDSSYFNIGALISLLTLVATLGYLTINFVKGKNRATVLDKHVCQGEKIK